mgnify:CR=1 FL=1|jgi:hypothetical protein
METIKRILFGKYCKICNKKQTIKEVEISSKYDEYNYSIDITKSIVCQECQNVIYTYTYQLDCGVF